MSARVTRGSNHRTESASNSQGLEELAAAAASVGKENVPILKIKLKPPKPVSISSSSASPPLSPSNSRKRTSDIAFGDDVPEDLIDLSGDSSPPRKKSRRSKLLDQEESEVDLEESPGSDEDLPEPHELMKIAEQLPKPTTKTSTKRVSRGKQTASGKRASSSTAVSNNKGASSSTTASSTKDTSCSKTAADTSPKAKGKAKAKPKVIEKPCPTIIRLQVPTIVSLTATMVTIDIAYDSTFEDARDRILQGRKDDTAHCLAGIELGYVPGGKFEAGKDKAKVKAYEISLIPASYMPSLIQRMKNNQPAKKQKKILNLDQPEAGPSRRRTHPDAAGAVDKDQDDDSVIGGPEDGESKADEMERAVEHAQKLEERYKGSCIVCGKNVWCKKGPGGVCVNATSRQITMWSTDLARDTPNVTIDVPPMTLEFDCFRKELPETKARRPARAAPPSAPDATGMAIMLEQRRQNTLMMQTLLEQRNAGPASASAPAPAPAPARRRALITGEHITSFIMGLHAMEPARELDMLLPTLEHEKVLTVGDMHRLGVEYLVSDIRVPRSTALYLIAVAEDRYPDLAA
ncbi:HTH-33 domain-containing protein [Mycena kentingensis (nom. inval.)]|nr:HTH-33 domain-containing protein [Mycena kentingensis (nom. inval.)]